MKSFDLIRKYRQDSIRSKKKEAIRGDRRVGGGEIKKLIDRGQLSTGRADWKITILGEMVV